MGFRDEGLATRERVDVLEREVARLRDENASLRAGEPAPSAEPAPRRLGLVALFVGLVAVSVTGLGASRASACRASDVPACRGGLSAR